jgi:hypothetical protein
MNIGVKFKVSNSYENKIISYYFENTSGGYSTPLNNDIGRIYPVSNLTDGTKISIPEAILLLVALKISLFGPLDTVYEIPFPTCYLEIKYKDNSKTQHREKFSIGFRLIQFEFREPLTARIDKNIEKMLVIRNAQLAIWMYPVNE